MSDQKCQSCHVTMFEGFHSGHPEFSDYPHSRRTRIYFDHQSHYGRHFLDAERAMPGGVKPDSCRNCHELDSAGNAMLVRGFEASCATCHSEQIEDRLLPGLVLAALPSLDVQAFDGTGLEIGPWPNNRDRKDALATTGELPPLMDFLLSADEQYLKNRETVQGLRLWDLQGTDKPQLEAAQQYIQAIKRLWEDLAGSDPQPLRERLQVALGPGHSAEEITALLSTLATDEFALAAAQWLPQSEAESPAAADGDEPPAELAKTPPIERAAYHFRDSSDLSIRYRPDGHADPFLRRWLEASAKSAGNSEAGARLLAALSNPAVTGRCLKCHTVDQQEDGAVVNWFAARPDPASRSFTKFSHRPHLVTLRNDYETTPTSEPNALASGAVRAGDAARPAASAGGSLGDQACKQCHNMKEEASDPSTAYRPEFFGDDWKLRTDPHHFNSNFKPLARSSCATCHNPSKVQDNCLSCHNYHVR